MNCQGCPDKPTCAILDEKNCPRLTGKEKYAREVPFMDLPTSINPENWMQSSSNVFCGNGLNEIKRRTREKALDVEGFTRRQLAAFMLLGCTETDFSIDEVCDLLNISRRSIFNWKHKLHRDNG